MERKDWNNYDGSFLKKIQRNNFSPENNWNFKRAFQKVNSSVQCICSVFSLDCIQADYRLSFCAGCFYSAAEILRLNGKEVFLISAITEAAARKRDENKFVLGPVTLVLGIILSAILWEKLPAAIGIYALAFGDGLASLAGKLFGRIQIPFTEGKTVAGSLTCFSAIFISCYLACFFMFQGQTDITKVSLIIAGAGMLIEILPLKDFDNLFIPILLGGLAQYLLC